MTHRGNVLTKWLLIILIVLVAGALGFGIWNYLRTGEIPFFATALKNENPVKVRGLQNDKETAIGTILYPGIESKNVEILSNNLAQKVTFDVKDSLAGVVHIYTQDLLNRYPNATCTQKEISKNDALNNQATVITCTKGSGKITVTSFANKNGLTSVTIEKQNNL